MIEASVVLHSAPSDHARSSSKSWDKLSNSRNQLAPKTGFVAAKIVEETNQRLKRLFDFVHHQ